MAGISATATVLRGQQRRLRVSVPVVARSPDGQVRYDGVATAEFQVAVGDPIPIFTVDVRVTTEELIPETADGGW